MILSHVQFQALTTIQIPKITTNQIPILTTGQIQKITTYQIQSLTTDQIPILTIVQIPSLTTDQIPILTTGQIQILTTNQIPILTTGQIQKITTYQIQSLTTDQIPILTIVQIPKITTDQIQSLTTYQIQILTTNQIPILTTGQIQKITTYQIQSLTTNQIPILTIVQIPSLTTDQIQSLTTYQIQILTIVQIPKITTDQIPILTTGQIQILTTNQIPILTIVQIPKITTDQIPILTINQIQILTTYQIQSLTTNQISNVTSEQLTLLTTNQIASFKTQQITSLTTIQISKITTNQISRITTSNVSSLLQQQITSLTTLEIFSLLTQQLSALTIRQVGYLISSQISLLSTSSISSLITSQIIFLNSSKIIILSTRQLTSITEPQALALLNTYQISIDINQINKYIKLNINNNLSINNTDYILNVKLGYNTDNYINLKTQQIIQQNQITSIKFSKYKNNLNNVYIYSCNNLGTNQIIICDYSSTDSIEIVKIVNIENNTNKINNFAITNEYVPLTFITASLQQNNSINIYVYKYSIIKLLWDQSQIYNITDEDNKHNKVFYSQISYNGNIMLVTYYYYNSFINDDKYQATYFMLYNSLSITSGFIKYKFPLINNIMINNYRQIILSYDGTKLYLLSYPIKISTNSYKSILYVTLIQNNNFTWSPLKEFILPNYGYCPIMNISYDSKCITVYYNDSQYCNIYMSFDYGSTWVLYKTNYNIYNNNTLDVTTMSYSGLYQTYLVSNKNISIYIGYFINNKWKYMYTNEAVKVADQFQTYNISNNFSNIIIYKPNNNIIENYKLTNCLTLNKLFNNLTYNYNYDTNSIINSNILLNIQKLNNAFNNVILYAKETTNIKNNMIENIGSKILRIINANNVDIDIIYPPLFEKYSILINTILVNKINDYIIQNKNQIIDSYKLTNQYLNDVQSLNTLQISDLSNIPLNINIDNLSLEIPLQIVFSGIGKYILLQISY
jgi:hypothetical protein